MTVSSAEELLARIADLEHRLAESQAHTENVEFVAQMDRERAEEAERQMAEAGGEAKSHREAVDIEIETREHYSLRAEEAERQAALWKSDLHAAVMNLEEAERQLAVLQALTPAPHVHCWAWTSNNAAGGAVPPWATCSCGLTYCETAN